MSQLNVFPTLLTQITCFHGSHWRHQGSLFVNDVIKILVEKGHKLVLTLLLISQSRIGWWCHVKRFLRLKLGKWCHAWSFLERWHSLAIVVIINIAVFVRCFNTMVGWVVLLVVFLGISVIIFVGVIKALHMIRCLLMLLLVYWRWSPWTIDDHWIWCSGFLTWWRLRVARTPTVI